MSEEEKGVPNRQKVLLLSYRKLHVYVHNSTKNADNYRGKCITMHDTEYCSNIIHTQYVLVHIIIDARQQGLSGHSQLFGGCCEQNDHQKLHPPNYSSGF